MFAKLTNSAVVEASRKKNHNQCFKIFSAQPWQLEKYTLEFDISHAMVFMHRLLSYNSCEYVLFKHL